jgi:hypothetical protein
MSDSNNPFMRHNGIKDWNVQPGADGIETGYDKKIPLETQKGLGDFK